MWLKKEKIIKAFQYTKESVMPSSIIEITGNHYAVIQGVCGILEYTENSVRIKLKAQEILVCGENLTIDCLSSDSLELKGEIKKIEYS